MTHDNALQTAKHGYHIGTAFAISNSASRNSRLNLAYSECGVPDIQVQCVVVLYKNTPKESKTIRSLIDCCHQNDIAERLSILIYDNSPAAQQIDLTDLPFRTMEYHQDAQNGGLAVAYNYALAIAQRSNIDWLLLLDQDTVVEVSLISSLLREVTAPRQMNVCAILPKLTQNGTMLSPQVVGILRNHPMAPEYSGLFPRTLTALNSGACLRVHALVQVGGFPPEYWLDYLDHIMFHRLQSVGGRVVVLDTAIQHHLSSMNLEAEMSVERYKNVLSAEWMFVRETGWGGGSLIHRMRLLKRGMSFLIKLRNRSYAMQIFKSILK